MATASDSGPELEMRCPRCERVISANSEEDLVAQVQDHARDDHGVQHQLTPKHILAQLHKRDQENAP